MPTADVKGIKINYQRAGSGPEIVMIHGLAANLAFWYLTVLPGLIGEYCVTVYDLRGHGKSDITPTGYTTADMAEDLRGLLDWLGIDRAHLAGHSFGGALALHFAIRYPRRASSLTLADSRLAAFQPSRRIKDWPYWELWKARLLAAGVTPPNDEREMDFMLLEEWAKGSWEEWSRQTDASNAIIPVKLWPLNTRGRQKWLQILRTTSARDDFCQTGELTLERIRAVEQPTLAIFGEYSHCLESLAGLQAAMVNCRSAVVPHVGHFHPAQDPGAFLRHFRKFLEEQSR